MAALTNLEPPDLCFHCGERCSRRRGGPRPEAVGQSYRRTAIVLDVSDGDDCRAAVLCWPCFWEIDTEPFLRALARHSAHCSPEHWNQGDPMYSYDDLPPLDHDDGEAWDVATYRGWTPA